MNLAERKRGLGGTDSPVVLGVSPWKSRKELWEEKRGLTMDIEPTPAMRRGIALEPLIAKIFSETTKRDLLPGTKLYHPKHPFITGHPDYFWGDTTDQTGILEIKCLGLRTFAKAKREGIPLTYQIQLQHYLSMGDCTGTFAIFNVDLWELIWFDVKPDWELIEDIIEADVRFWDLVEKGIPPAEEVGPIIEMPPVTTGVIQNNSAEWSQAVAQLREARQIREDAESWEEEIKATIQEQMGFQPIVEGGGARVYWTWQEGRMNLDKKALAKDGIDLSKYEKAGKPFRTFRPYFLKGGPDHE